MAFVTCGQFKESQDAQNKAAIKAEQSLLDCADNAVGVTRPKNCDDESQGGVITVDKIKSAIGGDVAVAVAGNSAIIGNGTKENPLDIGYTELATSIGSKDAGKNLLEALKENKLLGDGLDVVDGKLIVKTETVYDASGTEAQFYAVDK